VCIVALVQRIKIAENSKKRATAVTNEGAIIDPFISSVVLVGLDYGSMPKKRDTNG
jgi:hypothetical protein